MLDIASYFYTVKIEGDSPPDLIKKYKVYSNLLKEKKVLSVALLKNRFEKDKATLKVLLESHGYFNAKINCSIKEDRKDKFILTVHIDTGKPFPIDNIYFSGVEEQKEKKLREIIQLREKKFFEEESLKSSVERIIRHLKNNGYPFTQIQKPRLKVYFDKGKVDVYIDIQKDEKKYFGPLNIKIKNFKNLKPSFIENKIAWKEGDLYEQRLLDKTQKKLVNSGVVSYVSIKPEYTKSDKAVMRVKVYEAPPRIFLVEGGFSTAEKWSGRASWKHKNIMGNGESIELSTTISKLIKNVQIKTRFPYFFNISTLDSLAHINWINEKTSAYDGNRYGAGFGLEKELTENVTAGASAHFEIVHVTKIPKVYRNQNLEDDEGRKGEFNAKIASLPMILTWNKMNDELDPTGGFKIHLSVEPYFLWDAERKGGEFEKIDKFFTALESYVAHALRIYKNRTTNKKLVLYNKISIGNIFGAKLEEIIPHRRMYLGGVRTMRAYGEKKVGAIDDGGKPVGGISYGMWIAELRYRFREVWGVNIYNEIGFVSSKKLFDSDDKTFFKGTGFSVVYYSKIGPIQAGLTFPWHRRSYYTKKDDETKMKKESAFQFYVGIGQI